MLATLRIWKWTRINGIGEWPWQKPWDILSNWKWTYSRYGGRELLNQIRGSVWDFLRWHLHTRHQPKVKREHRQLRLETCIYVLECLAKDAEERAEELENANLHK
jgi:hypothetical protein